MVKNENSSISPGKINNLSEDQNNGPTAGKTESLSQSDDEEYGPSLEKNWWNQWKWWSTGKVISDLDKLEMLKSKNEEGNFCKLW